MSANTGWETLNLDFDIPENGTLQLYTANETADQNVWFDDFKVTFTPQLIVQENHYYPFGLELAGINKLTKPEHRWKFSGVENENNFGLNWINYRYRSNYNPQTARFFSVDPIAEQYIYLTPYQHASNNPASKIEIEGLEGTWFQESQEWILGGKNVQKTQSNAAKRQEGGWLSNTYLGDAIDYLQSKSDVAMGFSAAYVDNLTGGFIDLRGVLPYNDPNLYNQGQDAGDIASIGTGTAMINIGGTTAEAGAAVTLGSGGTASVVSVPTALGGLAVAAGGGVMVYNGTQNLANQKGRVYARSRRRRGSSGQSNAERQRLREESNAKAQKGGYDTFYRRDSHFPNEVNNKNPHTKLGHQKSTSGQETYKIGAEYRNGKLHKTIHHTNHSNPVHPKPHQHKKDPVTGKRIAEPLKHD